MCKKKNNCQTSFINYLDLHTLLGICDCKSIDIFIKFNCFAQ